MFSSVRSTTDSPYGQKYVDTWPSYPYVDIPQVVPTKLEAHNPMKACNSLYAVALQFLFTESKGPKAVQA